MDRQCRLVAHGLTECMEQEDIRIPVTPDGFLKGLAKDHHEEASEEDDMMEDVVEDVEDVEDDVLNDEMD